MLTYLNKLHLYYFQLRNCQLHNQNHQLPKLYWFQKGKYKYNKLPEEVILQQYFTLTVKPHNFSSTFGYRCCPLKVKLSVFLFIKSSVVNYKASFTSYFIVGFRSLLIKKILKKTKYKDDMKINLRNWNHQYKSFDIISK